MFTDDEYKTVLSRAKDPRGLQFRDSEDARLLMAAAAALALRKLVAQLREPVDWDAAVKLQRKKIADSQPGEAEGWYASNKCGICGTYYEKAAPYLCPQCLGASRKVVADEIEQACAEQEAETVARRRQRLAKAPEGPMELDADLRAALQREAEMREQLDRLIDWHKYQANSQGGIVQQIKDALRRTCAQEKPAGWTDQSPPAVEYRERQPLDLAGALEDWEEPRGEKGEEGDADAVGGGDRGGRVCDGAPDAGGDAPQEHQGAEGHGSDEGGAPTGEGLRGVPGTDDPPIGKAGHHQDGLANSRVVPPVDVMGELEEKADAFAAATIAAERDCGAESAVEYAFRDIRALVQGLVDRVAEVEETNRNNVAIAGLECKELYSRLRLSEDGLQSYEES